LKEAGTPYEARLIGFEDLGSDAYRQRRFITKDAIDLDAGWANTLDALQALALEAFLAKQRFMTGETT
jgi:hypothetical protein